MDYCFRFAAVEVKKSEVDNESGVEEEAASISIKAYANAE